MCVCVCVCVCVRVRGAEGESHMCTCAIIGVYVKTTTLLYFLTLVGIARRGLDGSASIIRAFRAATRGSSVSS